MQTTEYLRYIVENIHSTVFATVDGAGRPDRRRRGAAGHLRH